MEGKYDMQKYEESYDKALYEYYSSDKYAATDEAKDEASPILIAFLIISVLGLLATLILFLRVMY